MSDIYPVSCDADRAAAAETADAAADTNVNANADAAANDNADAAANANACTYAAAVASPGLYDLLWELGEDNKCGLRVYAERLPLMQMIVEICDHLDVDIFELPMDRSQIMICENPYQVMEQLESEGIKATVIGQLTGGKDRIIEDGDRSTFITPPNRRISNRTTIYTDI